MLDPLNLLGRRLGGQLRRLLMFRHIMKLVPSGLYLFVLDVHPRLVVVLH